MSSMELLLPEAYRRRLLKEIKSAKKRIVFAAMEIVADEAMMPILDAVLEAHKRGVKVHLLGDAFYRSPSSRPVGVSRPHHLQLVRRTDEVLRRFETRGAKVSIVGHLGHNQFKGRCHVKAAVVDDICFCFGGVNFTSGSFKCTDYMWVTHNPTLATQLQNLITSIGGREAHQDMETPIDSDSAWLFDSGKPGRSLIYQRAYELARRAQKIYYVSQMVPTGSLARAINATQHACYFNRPEQATGFLRLSLRIDKYVSKVDNLYKRKDFIHAKCILFELADGTKALISGSHNFSWRGVRYGTKEIALYSTNEKLWNELRAFIDKKLV